MFGIETLSGNAQAAVLVGRVLAEAFLLDAVYGGPERTVRPSFKRFLQVHGPFVDLRSALLSASEQGGANR